jgi:hypothetical protein
MNPTVELVLKQKKANMIKSDFLMLEALKSAPHLNDMRIASSTLQNCGISYFVFDDIASLAGSADAQNVDPLILSDIC